MTSVLIADDQTLVRTGFRLVLEGRHGIEVVGEVATERRRYGSPLSCGRTSS